MEQILILAILTIAALGTADGHMSTARSQGHTSGDDEKAIEAVIAEMTAAFNQRLPVTSLFTDDADYVNVQGMWLKGAAQIERGRKQRFETALKDARIKVLDVQIRFLKPDVAIAHVTHEIEGMLDSSEKKLPPHRELNIRVFVKQGGRWRVTAFQNTTIAAGAPSRPD